MLESLAEFDEQLMDKYVHDKPVEEDLIHKAIRKGTCAGKIHPVFVGSALRYIGVQRLLDGVGRCAIISGLSCGEGKYLPTPSSIL